jgi:hypothetical protein
MVIFPLSLSFLVLAIVFGSLGVFWLAKRSNVINSETPSALGLASIIIVFLLLLAGGFHFWLAAILFPLDRELASDHALSAAGLGSIFAFPILMIISLFAMARR